MTDRPTLDSSAAGPGQTRDGRSSDGLDRRIAGAVSRARWAMLWEDAWPRLAWPLGILAGFLAVSWLGLWLVLPDIARLIGVALFGLAFLASLAAFRGFRVPSRDAALARVEARSGFRHRPLAAYEDRLPANADAFARALWEEHRARLTRGLGRMQAGVPHPGLARRDRFALRPLLGLVLFVAVFAGSGQYGARILSAFSGAGLPATVEARLDAWVTPPVYTGRPPVVLTGDVPPATEPDGTIRVPEGSILVLRTPGARPGDTPVPVAVTLNAGGRSIAVAAKEKEPEAVPAAARPTREAAREAPVALVEHEVVLAEAASVRIERGGATTTWRFSVDPDLDPKIRLIGQPEVQRTGSVKLAYEMSDDYGVTYAEARFEPAPEAFGITSTARDVRPLVAAPEFPLTLPPGRARSGQAQTFRDLASHPWAGAKVRMTLVARDDANQEGRSDTVDMTLPEKNFSKPLARALVEQRRILALDANRAPRVTDAVDALMIAPEKFIDDASVFLGMRMVRQALVGAKTDDDLRATLDLIWAVALSIEDGDLTDAEKALRDAQEALRKAIEEGASEQEIAKLTQDLREALDKYLRELAQRAQQNPQAQSPMDPNQRVMRKQDLDRMLNRIEDLAKTGSRDAAKQMLSQLQQMLENLQAGRPQQRQQGGQQSEMSEAMDKLGEMIQRQQQLMDRTHRMDPRNGNRQGQRRQGQPNPTDRPMTPEEYAQALKELRDKQQELQQALRELQEKMDRQGLGQQGQEGQEGRQGQRGEGQQGRGQQQGRGGEGPLGEAGEAMGEATGELGQGRPGSATGPQGRALDALRQGARELADQMARQQGQGQGQPGNGPQGESSMNDDPLGRPRRHEGPDYSNTVKVPDEIDVQRARRILEDIRRRLGENYRPQFELDYLERLLRSE